jgi:microcystin degradation protein MlrC
VRQDEIHQQAGAAGSLDGLLLDIHGAIRSRPGDSPDLTTRIAAIIAAAESAPR